MSTDSAGGGGSDGTAFDTNADWYLPGTLPGAGSVAGGPDGESFWSAAWSGGGAVRGKVESAMKASNPDGLKPKAAAWTQAGTTVDGYVSKLSAVWNKVSGAWSGDDADQAHQIFGGLYKTLSDQSTNATNMGNALDNMHSNLSATKKSWGHDTSTMGGIGNWATGDQDREAADDYKNMMSTFKQDMGIMPKNVPTQVKPTATPAIPTESSPHAHAGAPGGAPNVGGPGSAAHAGNATPAHIQQPNLHNPNTYDPNQHGPNGHDPNLHGPNEHNPNLHDPTFTNPPNGGVPVMTQPPHHGGGGGIGLPGGTGAGVDTGGSLAGLDGGGAGLGAGGTGAGLSGAGGGLGAGGTLGGAGGGLGAGGALGGAAGGLGGGAGVGGGAGAGEGAGAVGAGGRGMMMPMHGSGNGDEDERERSTWLAEDEDVWDDEDDVPTVIS